MNGRKARILNLPLAGSLSAIRRTMPFPLADPVRRAAGPPSDDFADLPVI